MSRVVPAGTVTPVTSSMPSRIFCTAAGRSSEVTNDDGSADSNSASETSLRWVSSSSKAARSMPSPRNSIQWPSCGSRITVWSVSA